MPAVAPMPRASETIATVVTNGVLKSVRKANLRLRIRALDEPRGCGVCRLERHARPRHESPIGLEWWAHLVGALQVHPTLFGAARRVAESAASFKSRRICREQVESRYSNEATNSSGSHPVR